MILGYLFGRKSDMKFDAKLNKMQLTVYFLFSNHLKLSRSRMYAFPQLLKPFLSSNNNLFWVKK